MSQGKTTIWLTLLLSIFASNGLADEHNRTIRFGSVAMDTPQVMHKRLLPLTQYLSQELQRPVELSVAANMTTAIHDVTVSNVDLAYLTPVAYLRTREAGNTRLIAETLTNNDADFKLTIVTRDDSPIHSIDDLAGKRFAFGDPGALLQRAAVIAAGVDINKLGFYDFLDHHDNIIRGVLHREYDAGIVKDTMAYKWRNKGIRVLYSSEELPPFNITASPKMNDELYQKLRHAFLKLNINNPEHQEVIRALDPMYTGFAAADDTDYDIVRKLTQPFSKTEQEKTK